MTTPNTTDRRTAHEELQTDAPLCPDLGANGEDSATQLRRELTTMRAQLDRIEQRLEADR